MNISLFTLLGTIIWNSQRIQLPKIPILCTPCQRMQLYYLTDLLRFTLDLKYCSYEYFFSRLLEWSSGNHNAHKLPKSHTLSIKAFFSQSKRVQKKKWSREVKNLFQQLKLQLTPLSWIVWVAYVAIPALSKSSAKENKIFLYVSISFITNFFF